MILRRTAPLLSIGFGAALLCSACNKSQPPAPQATNTPAAPNGQPTVASAPPGTPNAVPPAAATPVVPAPGAAAAPVTAATPIVPATAGSASTPAAPVARAAAPAPAPSLVVPAGTRVTIRTTETLSTKTSDVGQSFTGVLNNPLSVRGGTAFARGTAVRGEVTSAKGRGRFKGAGVLGITLVSIGGHTVQTSEFVASEKGRGKRTAGFIGGGGGVGALIGGLAGGGKGALIGGLAGAGAGTAAGALTGQRDVTIPAESVVSFTTRSTIRVR